MWALKRYPQCLWSWSQESSVWFLILNHRKLILGQKWCISSACMWSHLWLAGQQDAKSIPEAEYSTDLGCRTFLCWGYLIRINGEEHFASLITDSVASSSPAFHMMYSAYKLNKQGDNRQPWCTPFPIWTSPCPVSCPVLTVASWPAYRFLRRKVRWPDIPISNFPVCCDPNSQRLSHSQ